MSIPRLVIVTVALLAAACGAAVTGPPELAVDQTACGYCGMFVSEPVFAAAYRVEGQEAKVFDDIGCMLKALRAETAAPITVWLQDAAGGGWIDAGEATFVASSRIPTPMGGGLLAYASASAAEKTAQAQGGEVVRSFAELTSRKGEAK